jgi:hypothetical protein
MALDWIPIAPGQVPHRRLPRPGYSVAPFTVAVIPVPLIAGRLAFLPTFPDRVPHHRQPVSRSALVQPLLFEAAIDPVSWTPTFPARTTAGLSPRHKIAAWPSVFAPPPAELVLAAQRLAWTPRYPSQVPHTDPPNEGGSFAAILPAVAAAGEPCVELIDVALTSPALITQVLTTTGFLQEALGTPALLQEDLC